MNNTGKIKQTIAAICKALDNHIEQDEDYGLLSGYSGIALFYAYYYQLTGKKKYRGQVYEIVEKTLCGLANKPITLSHCSGISGIAWCIQHLMQQGFIGRNEVENIFEETDEALSAYMKYELKSNHYDFLHEGLGTMLYFSDKLPDTNAQAYLEEAVGYLEKAMDTNANGRSWIDYSTLKNKTGRQSFAYNAGISHGVPAILSVLSILYEKNIAREKVLPLIYDGTQWLLNIKNKPSKKYISLYPTTITNKYSSVQAKQSRLGWCYGDLSVAIAMHNIGTRLQNAEYLQEAYRLFDYTLSKRNLENGGIADASLCHGSMGVSHIYRRAYLATGDSMLLKGAEKWLQHTLEMTTWQDGLAGFKYYTVQGYENNYNLLEGVAGIGLSLITALDKNIIPAWDRCMLMS